MQVLIDGQYYSREDAKISVFDHGLLYGDGIFEGIRIYNGRVFELDDHIARLYRSAKSIALEIPLTPEEMTAATVETVRRNELVDGYIRLVVTRGEGDLGLEPGQVPQGRATSSSPPPSSCTRRRRTRTASRSSPAPPAATPRRRVNGNVKSLNYLNNIIAVLELRGTGANEGLMLTLDGYVCECTADNFFMVKDGRVLTPHPSTGALPGITRGVVIELAREMGIEVEEGRYTLHDVYNADECFLTGTGAEAAPIVDVDMRVIGDGTPGPVTWKLIDAFRAYARSTGTPVYED